MLFLYLFCCLSLPFSLFRPLSPRFTGPVCNGLCNAGSGSVSDNRAYQAPSRGRYVLFRVFTRFVAAPLGGIFTESLFRDSTSSVECLKRISDPLTIVPASVSIQKTVLPSGLTTKS